MLRVEALSVAAGGRRVVDDLSLRIEKGSAVALVGPSGSGKSLTALALLGLLPDARLEASGRRPVVAGAPTIESGRVWLGPPVTDPQGLPVDVLALSETERRRIRGRRIGLVPQDPGATLDPLQAVGGQLVETLRIHEGSAAGSPKGRATRRGRRERALELLDAVGLDSVASRFGARPHQLSGGQRQRVAIALALAAGPEILVADEPTTALDVTLQAQVLDLLRGLRRRFGLALLLITHDLAVVAETCEQTIVLEAGCKVDEGPTGDLFRQPGHPATRALLAAARSTIAQPGAAR